MESLKSRPSQSRSTLPVVRVDPGLRTSPLGASEASEAFEAAWEILGPAVERSGENTRESVLRTMCGGCRQLWVSPSSAVVTEMLHYPSGLKVVNGWLAGGDLQEIVSWLPMLEDWGRQRGATEARVNGRRGWARAFGYQEFRSAMKKGLTNV